MQKREEVDDPGIVMMVMIVVIIVINVIPCSPT
jgi:hypothetical protein